MESAARIQASAAGLVLAGAAFRYGDLWVLRETDLDVPRGGDLIITGDNGVGKSTLLFVCAGLLPASAGKVTLDGIEPHVSTPSDLVRHGVRRGVVFDSGGLLSNLSALANVTLALRYHADVLGGLDEKQIEQRARDALSELRVAQTDFHALPAHLSLGVRKRVSLARALVLDPNFIFFDDPDAGLDSATRALVYSMLERFRDDPKMTMLIATNSRPLIERLGTEIVELSHGYLLQRASTLPLGPASILAPQRKA
ncbi:MAG TPA: ATP-binding cassette domain-containing protein [Polyangiaceae bacterium]|jgi:phospholipid/cholesterol/gamma-HCH transport system ATP-binding protein